MKKLVSFLLVLVLLFSVSLTACEQVPDDNTDNGDNNTGYKPPITDTPSDGSNPTGGEDDGKISVTSDFIVTYDTYDSKERPIALEFISSFAQKYGISLQKQSFSRPAAEYEIQIGSVENRDEYKSAKTELSKYATEGLGVSLIRVTEKRIMLFGSTPDAIEIAVNRALDTLFTEGGKIDKDTDELIIFDAWEYETNNTVVGYSVDDLSNLSQASSIKVDNVKISEFAPNVKTYTCTAKFLDGYPNITITPISDNCSVQIEQATADNNGVATVTITSANNKNITIYTINVDMEFNYLVNAEIVPPNGKDAIVTYVVDDGVADASKTTNGNVITAEITKDFMDAYPHLKFTYAIKMVDIATLTLSGDTYKIVNGEYQYTQSTKQKNNVAYWNGFLTGYSGRVELANHSFTHKWHGTNDDGGKFDYYTTADPPVLMQNKGDPLNNDADFPKGSSTKEIVAAQQILEKVFKNNTSKILIHPGISVRTSDYNGVTTYKTFFNQVLTAQIENGSIIASRGTFSPDKTGSSNRVNTPDIVATRRTSGIYALMTQNTQTVDQWTSYVDSAIAKKAWACFCIHNIADDDTSTYHCISTANARELFSYVEDRNDSVEVMNITGAYKYMLEWNSAKVTANAYKNEYITVSVTDELDNSTFAKALTVKVSVPSIWTAATAGGKTLTVHRNSDGTAFVYVNVVPDSDSVVVTGVI